MPGVVGEFGARGDLVPGDADSDVLEGTECPDDLADAEPGHRLEVPPYCQGRALHFIWRRYAE